MSNVPTRPDLLPENLLLQLPDFMGKIQQLSELIGLDLLSYEADHIALRVNSEEAARFVHEQWLTWGSEISNTQINGRPIIVLEFNQPVITKSWEIRCLELPYPIQGKTYPVESWEHVEFVIPSDARTADDYLFFLKSTFPNFKENMGCFNNKGIKVKLSCPKGKGKGKGKSERLANPTVAFKYQGVCIKLHPYSLKAVIESEKSLS